MIGAIAGDMIGARFERYPIKRTDFDLIPSTPSFTDDTVLTLAVADAILKGTGFAAALKQYAQKYDHLPYGSAFRKWVWSRDDGPYNSWGNGSAMRVSPVGFAYESIDDVLLFSKKSAEVTHNHPEGIKGAQATALSIFLARKDESKKTIRRQIEQRFLYNLNRTVDEIRPIYTFDISCQGSVPESIIAFLDSENYEDAVRKAISLGGDSDTMACISGGISQAYYKTIPQEIIAHVKCGLPKDLLEIVDRFSDTYKCEY